MSIIDYILNRMHVGETRSKIAKNLYWAVLGKVVTLLLGLVTGILVARYLGPEQYGLMNYVISFVTLFQVVSVFGLDNIEIRELAIEGNRNIVLGTAMLLRIALSLLTMGLIIGVACLYEMDVETRWLIALYGLTVILNTSTLVRNYFTAIVWNEYVVKTEIVRSVIGFGLRILLLWLHADLVYFLAACVLDIVLLGSGYFLSYRKKIGRVCEWQWSGTMMRYLLRESFPLFLSDAAVIIYMRIDKLMVGNILNNTELGLFAAAISVSDVLIYIPTIIAQTVTPILVKLQEKDLRVYQQRRQQFIDLTVWASLVCAIVVCLIAPWFVKYTFGVAYLAAVPLLQITAFRAVGRAFAVTSGQIVTIEHRQKWLPIRNWIGCAFVIGMNYWLLPLYGILAAAWISLAVTMLIGCLMNLFIPAYRDVFVAQMRSIVLGWQSFSVIRNDSTEKRK